MSVNLHRVTKITVITSSVRVRVAQIEKGENNCKITVFVNFPRG